MAKEGDIKNLSDSIYRIKKWQAKSSDSMGVIYTFAQRIKKQSHMTRGGEIKMNELKCFPLVMVLNEVV